MRRGQITFTYARTEHETSSCEGAQGGIGASKSSRDLTASLTGAMEINLPGNKDYLTPTVLDGDPNGQPIKIPSQVRFDASLADAILSQSGRDEQVSSYSVEARYREDGSCDTLVMPPFGPTASRWIHSQYSTEGGCSEQWQTGANGSLSGSLSFDASDADGKSLAFSLEVRCPAVKEEKNESIPHSSADPTPSESHSSDVIEYVSCDFKSADDDWVKAVSRSSSGITISAHRICPATPDSGANVKWTKEELHVELETSLPLKLRIIDDLSGTVLSETGEVYERVVGQ